MPDKDITLEKTSEKFKKPEFMEKFSREILTGSFFFLFGIYLLFNDILDVKFGIAGLFAFLFFLAGITEQVIFILRQKHIEQLLHGNIFLLASAFFADSFLAGNYYRIFLLFVFFQITAVLMLAYTMKPEYKYLPVLSFLGFLLVIIQVVTALAAFTFRDLLIFASIAVLLLVLYYQTKSIYYAIGSLIAFILGLNNITQFGLPVLGLIILWLLTASFMILYLLKPEQWWWLLSATTLLVGSFSFLATEFLGIIPEEWNKALWSFGVSAAFLIVWLQRQRFKKVRWTIIPSIIFFLLAIAVLLSETADANILLPFIFVTVGSLMILRKMKKTG